MFWLLLGLALLGAVLWFSRWYANAPASQAKRAFKILAGLAAGVIAFLLLTRGGLPLLASLAGGLLPILLGLRGAMRRGRAAQGPAPGGASNVSSDWFEMTLDHETGAIEGRVLQGPHAGRSLDDLDEATLDAIADDCRDDTNSRRLLAAYMARRFGRPGPDPEDDEAGAADEGGARSGDSHAAGRSGRMSRSEALAILGLEEGADADQVRRAYRRLISQAHPDRGGSAYLAAKINEARSVLLGGA